MLLVHKLLTYASTCWLVVEIALLPDESDEDEDKQKAAAEPGDDADSELATVWVDLQIIINYNNKLS